MAIWWRPVYSSRASEVGYDDETSTLYVKWTKGGSTAYEGVPEELALQLSQAPSVGSMINSEITPFYKFRNSK